MMMFLLGKQRKLEAPVSSTRHPRDSQEEYSSLPLISSNFSLFSTLIQSLLALSG
jgi:hypothetical protein